MEHRQPQLKTASHNLHLGTAFGSTPVTSSPMTECGDAREVVGEGLLLLLTGDPERQKEGEVVLYLDDGKIIKVSRVDEHNLSVSVSTK